MTEVEGLNEFHARNFERQHEAFAPAHSLMALVVCVQEEVGELAAAVLGVTNEKKRKAHLTREDVFDAVADAMTYLSLIAANLGEMDLDGLLRRTFNLVSMRAGSKIFLKEVPRRPEDEGRQVSSGGRNDAEAFRPFASESTATPEACESPKPVASATEAPGDFLVLSCPQCAALPDEPCVGAPTTVHLKRKAALQYAGSRCHCGALHDRTKDPHTETLVGGALVAALPDKALAPFAAARVCRVCGVVYCQPKREGTSP